MSTDIKAQTLGRFDKSSVKVQWLIIIIEKTQNIKMFHIKQLSIPPMPLTNQSILDVCLNVYKSHFFSMF